MESRVFIRVVYQNVPGHKRIAVDYPRVEAVTEEREDSSEPWAEVASLDISEALKESRLETAPGGLVSLWLQAISVDIATVEEDDPHITFSPANEARYRREMVDG